MDSTELLAALRSFASDTAKMADVYEREWRLESIHAAIDAVKAGAYAHAALHLSIVPGSGDLYHHALALDYDVAEERFLHEQGAKVAEGTPAETLRWSL